LTQEVKKSFYTTVDHPFDIKNVEDVVCDFCGSEAFCSIGKELDYDLRQCDKCRLVYINPQPTADEILGFYDNMYLDDSPEEVAARGLGYTEKQLRRIVRKRKPDGGKLLDIGCGFGAVLAEMAKFSKWTLEGVEIGDNAINYVRKRVPSAKIHEGTVDDVDFDPGTFDCIMMITVLEHVKNPTAVLERITKWLAPGGLLVIQTPHVEPFIKLKQYFPQVPIYFEAPRHLFDFSPRTLAMYFERSGCEDMKIDIAVPYACGSFVSEVIIWSIKSVGYVLHRLTFGRYILPYSGGLVAHGIKTHG
jgi:2-polyprenyl-3-methyl-5-hydroxy-6-metoxy-1,4-benzoquinol methylase